MKKDLTSRSTARYLQPNTSLPYTTLKNSIIVYTKPAAGLLKTPTIRNLS